MCRRRRLQTRVEKGREASAPAKWASTLASQDSITWQAASSFGRKELRYTGCACMRRF